MSEDLEVEHWPLVTRYAQAASPSRRMRRPTPLTAWLPLSLSLSLRSGSLAMSPAEAGQAALTVSCQRCGGRRWRRLIHGWIPPDAFGLSAPSHLYAAADLLNSDVCTGQVQNWTTILKGGGTSASLITATSAPRLKCFDASRLLLFRASWAHRLDLVLSLAPSSLLYGDLPNG